MNCPKLPMLKRSKSTSCFVFRNEVKRKTRSENDIQSHENSFEKRKIEVRGEIFMNKKTYEDNIGTYETNMYIKKTHRQKAK